MKQLLRRWKEDHWEVLVLRMPYHKRRSWMHIARYEHCLALQRHFKQVMLGPSSMRLYPMYSMTKLLSQL